jgi:CheY-like chemotaxis protein
MTLEQVAPRTVVLLVEDEPLVRMVGADLLEEAGFEVVEASNGDEALSVLETGPMYGCCSPTSTCRARSTGSNWPRWFTSVAGSRPARHLRALPASFRRHPEQRAVRAETL